MIHEKDHCLSGAGFGMLIINFVGVVRGFRRLIFTSRFAEV